MKAHFYHGLIAGIFASLAAYVYNRIYGYALAVDFSVVVNLSGILAACFIGTVVAATVHFFFKKIVKKYTEVFFNALFTIVTFASMLLPLSTSLPLEISSPELFLGLTIPMHMMPQLFWLTTKPMFHD